MVSLLHTFPTTAKPAPMRKHSCSRNGFAACRDKRYIRGREVPVGAPEHGVSLSLAPAAGSALLPDKFSSQIPAVRKPCPLPEFWQFAPCVRRQLAVAVGTSADSDTEEEGTSTGPSPSPSPISHAAATACAHDDARTADGPRSFGPTAARTPGVCVEEVTGECYAEFAVADGSAEYLLRLTSVNSDERFVLGQLVWAYPGIQMRDAKLEAERRKLRTTLPGRPSAAVDIDVHVFASADEEVLVSAADLDPGLDLDLDKLFWVPRVCLVSDACNCAACSEK